MNTLSDNALMMKVKAGDLDRMGLLFERYNRKLYGFLFHMTYQREASEDMVQQVFYKMLKYRQSFTGNGEFHHWMYTIARNVLKDRGKQQWLKMKHESVDELADRLPGDTNAAEQLERKQAHAQLYHAMGKLGDEHREVLVLCRFQELKHKEIAALLAISEGAVKVRVHRAMQELKEIYQIEKS